MSKIGYIRVSTTEQETGRQEELMKQIGVDKVFTDKATGKNTDRPEFQAMMSYLRDGDILYVESISRLSRSIRDLLRTIDELNIKGVKFVSSKESIDTTTPQGRFVLSIFAALSELEREQTLQRQREGIAIMRATHPEKYQGKQFRKIDESLFLRLYSKWQAKEITAVTFQQRIGLKAGAFYHRIRHFKESGKVN